MSTPYTITGATAGAGTTGTYWRPIILAAGVAATGLAVLAYRKYGSPFDVDHQHRGRKAPTGTSSGKPSPRERLLSLKGTEDLWTPPASAHDVDSMFKVTTQNGFLPLVPSMRKLPAAFESLEQLMVQVPDLLASEDPSALLNAVSKLPQLDIPADATPSLMQSLMRDYSVLVSAYLLEGKRKSGKPRNRVPANIAVPFVTVCKTLDEQWILSYDSYCLSNCMTLREDKAHPATGANGLLSYVPSSGKWEWENLRLIRAFDGGPEEYTFIAVHFEIESNTADLIKSYATLLRGLKADSKTIVTEGLTALRTVCERIIVSQLKMFNASNPHNYETYVRPWIFGWKGNPDFESGVIFEGASDKPTFLRGETGAQSTIIPSLDVILGVTHKADMLRVMLQELEAYRPKPHRDFLATLRTLMWGSDTGAGAASTEKAGSPATTAPLAASPVNPDAHPADLEAPHALRDFVRSSRDKSLIHLFNECVAMVWAFRDIHVTYASLYIGRYTDRETATGGTPYKTYLRKHRDESMAHQLDDFGGACLVKFAIPTTEAFDKELTAALEPSTRNGIPAHLLARHAGIIAKYGRDSESLKHKAYPTGSEWQRHAATSKAVAGAGK